MQGSLGGRLCGLLCKESLFSWVIPLPLVKAVPENTKYGSVCLLMVRSKVPSG